MFWFGLVCFLRQGLGGDVLFGPGCLLLPPPPLEKWQVSSMSSALLIIANIVCLHTCAPLPKSRQLPPSVQPELKLGVLGGKSNREPAGHTGSGFLLGRKEDNFSLQFNVFGAEQCHWGCQASSSRTLAVTVLWTPSQALPPRDTPTGRQAFFSSWLPDRPAVFWEDMWMPKGRLTVSEFALGLGLPLINALQAFTGLYSYRRESKLCRILWKWGPLHSAAGAACCALQNALRRLPQEVFVLLFLCDINILTSGRCLTQK